MSKGTYGYNKAILIGRLGQDPEIKQGTRSEYANFSLCNVSLKDGRENVQWHKICAFGKQASLCKEYLRKGDLCCIEGRIDNHTYEKNGERHVSNTIIAERITFLSSRKKGGNEEHSRGTKDSAIA